jgi:hypothetical protein
MNLGFLRLMVFVLSKCAAASRRIESGNHSIGGTSGMQNSGQLPSLQMKL